MKTPGEVVMADGRLIRVMPISAGIAIEIWSAPKTHVAGSEIRGQIMHTILDADTAKGLVQALREIGWA